MDLPRLHMVSRGFFIFARAIQCLCTIERARSFASNFLTRFYMPCPAVFVGGLFKKRGRKNVRASTITTLDEDKPTEIVAKESAPAKPDGDGDGDSEDAGAGAGAGAGQDTSDAAESDGPAAAPGSPAKDADEHIESGPGSTSIFRKQKRARKDNLLLQNVRRFRVFLTSG